MRYDLKPNEAFGAWLVLKEVQSKTKHRRVLCKCICNAERVVLLQNLLTGTSKSCGCQSKNKSALSAAKSRLQKLYK